MDEVFKRLEADRNRAVGDQFQFDQIHAFGKVGLVAKVDRQKVR